MLELTMYMIWPPHQTPDDMIWLKPDNTVNYTTTQLNSWIWLVRRCVLFWYNSTARTGDPPDVFARTHFFSTDGRSLGCPMFVRVSQGLAKFPNMGTSSGFQEEFMSLYFMGELETERNISQFSFQIFRGNQRGEKRWNASHAVWPRLRFIPGTVELGDLTLTLPSTSL